MKRRKPLKRTPLKPGKSQLKRSPLARGESQLKRGGRLNPISKKRRTSERRAKVELLDSKGRSMEAAPQFIPLDVRTKQIIWPPGEDVKDSTVAAWLHATYTKKPANGGERVGKCWRCGKTRRLDAAHIVPRSDELCNFMMLCSNVYGSDSCHVWQEKNWTSLREILTVKCQADRIHTDFVRILELRRNLEIK